MSDQKQKRYECRNVEIHITHACNLACEGCGHYCNHGHQGTLTVEEFHEQTKPWSQKLQPEWLSLMGGEPTLNKDLLKMIELSALMWKSPTKVRVITNGFLLHRLPDLPKVIKKHNVQLLISIHHNGKMYQGKLKSIKSLVDQWENEYDLDVVWRTSYNEWLIGYEGFGDNMQPFEDGNPQKSWESCWFKHHCKQIYLGKLWKCSRLAYLQMQDKKFKLNDKWLPYLTYRDGDLRGQAIEPTATYEEIEEFFEYGYLPHCGMCPNEPMRGNNLSCPISLIL